MVDTQVQAYIPDHTRPDQHWFVSQTRTQLLSSKAYSLQFFFFPGKISLYFDKEIGKFLFF
jgi:hypothetical protein